MDMWLKVLSIIFLLHFSECANIVGVIPSPSYSHQVAFLPLWKELTARGHAVTVVTTDPVKDQKVNNLTEIDVSFLYGVLSELKFHEHASKNDAPMWVWRVLFFNLFGTLSKRLMTDQNVQELFYNKNKHVDIVLLEAFYPEFLALGKVFNCPTVLIGSFDVDPYIHYVMGNPSHPILHHDFTSTFYGKLNFQERILSTLYNLYVLYLSEYVALPQSQNILNEYFPNVNETVKELMRDIDMMFLSIHPVLQGVRAIGPTTINIGGGRIMQRSTGGLSQDLKQFLDAAKNGFIYFSLGSNVKSKDLKPHTIKVLLDTFKEIPLKVVWKFEADQLPGKPENVKLVKWAPQQEILNHTNIKLFITQGGLQSMEEAINYEVPMVVMPFFGDQEKNAKLMESKKIAKVIRCTPELTKDDLKNTILEVIQNSMYSNAVKNINRLIKDEPMSGLEKAVWWTEYLIRNKGAKHLRNPAANLPYYQYYLVDVIGFIILLVLLIFAILRISIKIAVLLLERVYPKTKFNETNNKKTSKLFHQ